MELSELRAHIDAVDGEIKRLLKERFALSKAVGKSKMQSGNTTVFRADREQEILDKIAEGFDEDDQRAIREIYRNIMVNSRRMQYYLMALEDKNILKGVHIEDMSSLHVDSLICQGIEGAYSNIAAQRYKEYLGVDAKIDFLDSFKEVFDAIDEGKMGILPLDNSTEGMVNAVYDLLLEHEYYIIASIDLPIKHAVLANSGATHDTIKCITAHEQALAQCSKYIEKYNLSNVRAVNNAVAVKDVKESGRCDIAAIADISNAKRYGIDVIDEDIANSALNTTRFIVVASKMYVPAKGGKVSIVCSMDNSSGSLAGVLNMISSYGVSMSKIESRPIADDKWEYRFYIDIVGNIREDSIRALLYELHEELPFMKVLGSFEEI